MSFTIPNDCNCKRKFPFHPSLPPEKTLPSGNYFMKNNWVLHETKMLLPGSLNCSHPNVCSRGNNSIDQYFTCKVKHWITELIVQLLALIHKRLKKSFEYENPQLRQICPIKSKLTCEREASRKRATDKNNQRIP